MSGPLSAEQVEFFRREGYLCASGLIDAELVRRAEAELWEWLGVDRSRPESWPKAQDEGKERLSYLNDDVFVALHTPAFRSAISQLTGRRVDGSPELLQAIVAFKNEAEWRVLGCHVDNAVESWGLTSFPPSQFANTLIYLNDVEERGGGTAVWPGWHNKLTARMKNDPEHYHLLYTVQKEIVSGEIDLGDPVILSPRAGDVVVLDPYIPHAGTVNVTDRPRFALTWQLKGEQQRPDAERSKAFYAAAKEHLAEQRKLGRKRAYVM